MKNLLMVASMVALGGASVQGAPRPVQAAETKVQQAGRAFLMAAYKKQDAAMLKNDLATMMSYVAPDFQMVCADRTYNRTQTQALWKKTMDGSLMGMQLSYVTCSTRLFSLAWQGNDAVIMAETTAVATAQKDGRPVRVEQVSLARDYWGPTSHGWKIRQSIQRMGKLWLNGKRVP